MDTGAAMLGWIYYAASGNSGWFTISTNNAWYYLAESDASGAWLFMPY